MKKNLFLMIAVLAASPVMGQDAKQIADSLSIPPVSEATAHAERFRSPD